jgi:thiol-disulfide isomerase/thioredoxin
MRSAVLAFTLLLGFFAASAQTANGPTDPKAQKTYSEALQALRTRRYLDAFDKFKKANKQDGGHCSECLKQILTLASQLGDFKAADSASRDLLAQAKGAQELAEAHYQRGLLLLQEGMAKKKNELFAEADQEFKSDLSTNPKDRAALYADGLALAHLKQDDGAKTVFQQVAELSPAGTVERSRAQRFAARPELVRERIAPAFAFTAENGSRVSMDELQGKVVLLDFWATWCGPCREALPHIKHIAQKFSTEPLVIVSVSLDSDEQKWKDFVAKNEMGWFQYWDGGFEGPMARLFDVHAIPHTFTIDADGVLQDERVGDTSIEGKLKKLVARARQLQESRGTAQLSGR